jgi:hypothetical protein
MIWLLGEIALSLLLAGIAGWYIGWTVRGFRDGDRVEDLRRTLRATEEVKERELAEASRRADKSAERNERLQRENERLLERLEAGPAMPTFERALLRHDDEYGTRERARRQAAATLASPVTETDTDDDDGMAEGEHARIALRLEERLAEAQAQAQDRERALRDKAAALLAVEAELARLREAAEERASQMAKLEQRLVQLEPLEERLAQEDEAAARAWAETRRAEQERDEAQRCAKRFEDEVAELRAELDGRDLRINDLRVRYQNLAAEVEEARAARHAVSPVSSSLENTRRLLQRQIERNRKQDALHRQIVSNLQRQLAEWRERRAEEAPSSPASRTDEARG